MKVYLLFVWEINTDEVTHLGIFSSREKAEKAFAVSCFSLSTFEKVCIDEFELDVCDD